MSARELLRSNWHVVAIAATIGAAVCAAIFLVGTMPPRSIVMATGPEGGAYNEIGKQYRDALASAGVRLKLVATAGSLDNLAMLRNPRSDVSVALVQGGQRRQGPERSRVAGHPVLRAAMDIPSRQSGWHDPCRAARPQDLDRPGGQRIAGTHARAAQAQQRR
jgi:hypothetical protein